MTRIAGALAALLVLFIVLYRKALYESRVFGHYTLMLLLDDGVCAMQRKGLTDLVRSLDANSAGNLFPMVKLSLDRLAERLNINPLGVAGLLWKLKG
jgi:hypothetical protein